MMMSEIASAAREPFWAAEMDYRRERARNAWGSGSGARHRLRLRRRPSLKQAQRSRRALAVG